MGIPGTDPGTAYLISSLVGGAGAAVGGALSGSDQEIRSFAAPQNINTHVANQRRNIEQQRDIALSRLTDPVDLPQFVSPASVSIAGAPATVGANFREISNPFQPFSEDVVNPSPGGGQGADDDLEPSEGPGDRPDEREPGDPSVPGESPFFPFPEETPIDPHADPRFPVDPFRGPGGGARAGVQRVQPFSARGQGITKFAQATPDEAAEALEALSMLGIRPRVT